MKKKTKAQVRKEYATLEEKDADYLKSLGMDQKSALLGVMRGFRDKGMDSSNLEANQDDDSSDDGSAVPTEVDVESVSGMSFVSTAMTEPFDALSFEHEMGGSSTPR